MDLRNALRLLRGEVGLSQTELANALHVNYATVNRWEAGRTTPNPAMLAILVQYASSRAVSQECLRSLETAAADAKRLKLAKDSMHSVEHAALGQLVDDASFPVYVCDLETDDLLYLNRAAEALLDDGKGRHVGQKCYRALMRRDTPCSFCRKAELRADRFVAFRASLPGDDGCHLVQGKKIVWNLRRAQVRCFMDVNLADNRSADDMAAVAPAADSTAADCPANASVTDAIAKRLFAIDYETIITIDAETGEAHVYMGSHVRDVLAEQRRAGSNAAGVEAYLRRYCADEDVDSVVRGTSLPYVKERLHAQPVYHVTYSLRLDGQLVYKRVMYAYLDDSRRTILCAMQNLTDLHALEDARRDQLADALQALQEQGGMDIARYDLRTGRFYSNSAMTSAVGYGSVIEDVPERFIRDGLIAPAFVEAYRDFYAKLRAGETGMLSVPCKVGDGSFHWLQTSAQMLYDKQRRPFQALLAFRDVEQEREQAAVYRRWRQSLNQRPQTSYTLVRSNLNRGTGYDKVEGTLLRLELLDHALQTVNERSRSYASRFVHIDDFDAYTSLVNTDRLLADYHRGVRSAELVYRERIDADAYRTLRLTVEMTQYPDSADVELLALYEPCESDAKPEHAAGDDHAVFDDTGVMVVTRVWPDGAFAYPPELPQRVAGRYDDRPLWEIWLAENVADAQDVKALQQLVYALADTPARNSGAMELLLRTPSGARHWFSVNLFKRVDPQGRARLLVMTLLDVHGDVLTNRRLRLQAEHDSLTGLYNRATFLRLVAETVRGKPADAYLLLCGDVNDFELFNNRFGREEGDRLLQYAAERLRAHAESVDGFAGRLSNDVFAALLPNTEDMLRNATAAVRGFFIGYPLRAKLTGRAGVCVVSDPAMTADTILDRAATAKDSIKGKYGAWLAVFNEGMNAARLHEKYVTDRMEAALAEGQFDVYIQPQFHHGTGQIVGAEALARWNDPERGVVSPAEFIPAFEKNGFITRLDAYIWDKTARYLGAWIARGNEPVPISVNVSREDASDPGLCARLLAITEKHSVPTHLFRLEITESLFAENPKRLAAFVDELHEAGFLVEMDDFGSGYSSLNILKDVPVDVLKLDMRFLSGDDNLGRGGMILNAVLRMARWLRMPVIAEGVELKEQADFLLSIGCPTVQGFLYQRPMPVPAFERLMRMSAHQPPIPEPAVETLLNEDSFWNPLSADSHLFNRCIGPAVVFEYHNGTYEIVRMNARFADLLGVAETDALLPARDVTRLREEDRPRLRKAVLDVIYTGRDAKLDVRYADSSGTEQPCRVALRVVAKSPERSLLFAELDA